VVIPVNITYIGDLVFSGCKCDAFKYKLGVKMCNCEVGKFCPGPFPPPSPPPSPPPPTCIEDGCVKGDIKKKAAKKRCCHGGHETLKCKKPYWRCDRPTGEIRGLAFEFTQV
jgi:hypothetical protein